MKLQVKYNRATISAAVFVLLMGSISYYFLLRYILIKELDDSLKVEEQEIIHHIQTQKNLPEETQFRDQQIHFIPTANKERRRFVTTEVFNKSEKESQISRQLIFPVSVNGQQYTALVSKSEEETEDMLILIGFVTAGVILLLFIFLFIANRILFQKIWKPFYATLSAMKQFNLSNPGKLILKKNEINEFNDLNTALGEMTQKVAQDYQSLKTFADNASHEMQTPLAVINSKLDLLIQDQELTEKNMQHLQSIYDSISKLTRLNQSLLLMTKIENQQFRDAKKLRIDELLNEQLSHFEELINSKQLRVSTSLEKSEAFMNPMLADILINNILANAIRHNVQAGRIEIESGGNYFAISNHSNTNPLDKQSIFHRFQKGNGSDGLGLGLAIVKQICELYGFQVGYTFNNQMHAFRVKM